MSHPMIGFAHACSEHLKKGAPQDGEGVSFEVQEVYGRAGVSRRMGITVHTEPDASHPDVIGYRIKMSFPSYDARAKASGEIDDIQSAIRNVFGLQNDAAWKLLDKNSNDVWFTFVVNADQPERSMMESLGKLQVNDLFQQQRGCSRDR